MTDEEHTYNEETVLLGELPQQFDISDLSPRYLARYYRPVLSQPHRFQQLRARLLDLLLNITVHQAFDQSPYYGNLYGELPENIFVNVDNLGQLPIVTRADVERAGSSLCSSFATYSFSSYTSGTTGRKPLIVDRSSEEQKYLNCFFSILYEPSSGLGNELVVLSFESFDHGRKFEIPGAAYVFPVSLAREAGYYQAIALLGRTLTIGGKNRRINCLGGAYTKILLFTIFLSESGLRQLSESVGLVVASGAYQTAYSRRWLQEFWDCEIIDRYSLAELFFGAKRCPLCSLFHFEPYGVAEAVDLRTGKRLDEGRGALLLTGFFPFNQMTPLIRYRPGDLVVVRRVDCPIDHRGFRLLGRSTDSIELENETVGFLGSAEVLEVLDPLPDVSRVVLSGMSLPEGREIGIRPKFRLGRKEDGTALLIIELNYAPDYFPERVQQLKNLICRSLADVCPRLSEGLSKGLLSIGFEAPGTLDSKMSTLRK